MSAEQPKQPVVCGLCDDTGWLPDPYDSGVGMRCTCGGRAAADGCQSAPAAEREAFAAAPGSANVSGAREQSGVGGEWVAKLRVTDQRAREGAAFCWENACSVEAINMGDKFWAIHCDILAILEGAGEQGSDSEPSHSPSGPG